MSEPRRPDLFVVGAPKCGTTAMTRYLDGHPQIFMAARKDLHHFGSDLDFRRPRPTLEQYLAHFDPAGDALRVGDSSVWYLYSRRAAEEIRAFSPDARILVMLRDPVEVMYALWAQLRLNGLGDEDIDDFAEALRAEPDRARGLRIPPTTPLPSALLYRRAVTFSEQVQRYHDTFGPDRVKVVLQDDLRADTAAVFRDVLAFLEVDPHVTADLREVNTSKAVRSEAVRHLLRATPDSLKNLLPASLRQRARATLRRVNSRHQRRAPMELALRRDLCRELRPEVDRLAEVIGRDLSAWCRPEVR